MEQRIGFGKRLGALLLDCVIVAVLVIVGGGIVGGMLGLNASSLPSNTDDPNAMAAAMSGATLGAIMGMMAAMAVIGLVYFLIEGFTGYTLGKLILGIRIANEDGSQASVTTLLGRWALKNINFLCVVLAVATGVSFFTTLGRIGGLIIFVGCFFALGMARQALHDKVLHTAVYPKNMVRAAA
jgi:uncharacterized RDD family membrane protein YckC